MIARETFFSMAGVTRLRNRRALRRRLWRETLKGVLIFAAMVGLVVWLWGCVREASGGKILDAGCWMLVVVLAMAPLTQGEVMGLGAFVIVVVVVLAVRKMREWDEFYASLREAEMESQDWEEEPRPFTTGPLESLSEDGDTVILGRTEDEDIFAPSPPAPTSATTSNSGKPSSTNAPTPSAKSPTPSASPKPKACSKAASSSKTSPKSPPSIRARSPSSPPTAASASSPPASTPKPASTRMERLCNA